MLRIHSLVAILLLAGCAAQQASSPPIGASAPAADRKIEESNGTLSFSYAWPAAAERLSQLRARLERELAKDRAEAAKMAADDRKARRSGDIPFNPHDFAKSWSAPGDTPALLSLVAEIYAFTGGAHGNTGYHALLWDKQADREVTRGEVVPAALLASLTASYCAELDRLREQKRGEPMPADKSGMFDQCPSIADQTIFPADANGNARFDTIMIVLGPYEAGPYVEGSYEVELPVDAATLAAIPTAWRDNFEIRSGTAQPQ